MSQNDGNHEANKKKLKLGPKMRKFLKGLLCGVGGVLLIALLMSFHSIRALFYPVSLFGTPSVSFSETCPVYTTEEKPQYILHVEGADHYRVRVYEKDSLRRWVRQVKFKYDVLPDFDIDSKHLAQLVANAMPVLEQSGGVKPLDFNRAMVDYVTSKTLKQGDYAVLVDATNSFNGKSAQDMCCFRVTNLGAIVKRDLEKVVVRTLDLRTRQNRPNAAVGVYLRSPSDAKNIQPLLVATTNSQGLAELKKPAGTGSDAWTRVSIDAKEGGDRAYIGPFLNSHPLHQTDGNYQSDQFQDYSHRCITYFNTDRPIYRLGQTVYFNAYSRMLQPNGIYNAGRNKKVAVSIKDPEYQDFFSGSFSTDDFGRFSGSVNIPPAGKTGNYQVEVRYDDNNVDTFSFAVDQYRKPEYSVTVAADSSHVIAGGKLKLKLKANYYFGGGVPNAKVDYTISPTINLSSREKLRPRPGYYKYFEDWGVERPYYAYDYSTDVPLGGTAQTDGNGQAIIEIDTPEHDAIANSPTSYDFCDRSYNVVATVTDASRKAVVGTGDALVTRGDVAILAVPNVNFAQRGDTIHLDLTAASYDQKALPNQNIEVKMVQWVPKDQENTKWDRKIISTKNATTATNGNATVDFELGKDLSSDDYYFVATSKDSQGRTVGDVSRIWVTGNENNNWWTHASPLSLRLDKPAYTPSETAKLMVSSPVEKGESIPVLFTIEGQKLHEYKIVTLTQPAQVIEIPLKDSYAPNVHVGIAYVDKGHKPVIETKLLCVAPDQHFLQVKLASDKPLYKAGENAKFSVKVWGHDGKPAANTVLALSVADESVYAAAHDVNAPVQGVDAPDIFTTFYGQRDNWVETKVSFTDTFAPQPEELSLYDGAGFGALFGFFIRSGQYEDAMMMRKSEMAALPRPVPMEAGKGMADTRNAAPTAAPAAAPPPPMQAARPRSMTGSMTEPRVRKGFKDLAGWFPMLVTDAAGSAHADVKMPDDLTTWRATIAGIDRQTDVGQGQTSVTTTQDFVARLSLPRFFTQGDKGLVTAILHNYSTSVQPVALTLSMSGPQLKSERPLTTNISIPINGVQRYSWPVSAIAPGSTTIKLVAKGKDAGDALEVKLPVRSFTYQAFFAQGGVLRDPVQLKKFPLVFPADANLAKGKMEIALASSQLGPVLGSFDTLIDYPYGCTEQTLSRLVPSTIAMRLHKQFAIAMPAPLSQKFAEVFGIAMPKLTEYQHEDGGWGWWKDDSSSAYMTAHVLEGLYQLRQAGYTIDDSITERGVNYLQQQSDGILNGKWETENAVDQAKAAYVLSLYGRPISPSMQTWHMVHLSTMTPEELSYLTLAFSHVGSTALAQQTYKHLLELKNVSNDYIDWDHTPELLKRLNSKLGPWDYTYRFTGVETTALALRAVVAMEPKNDALMEPISHWIVTQHDENGWNNTKSTAQVFEALLEMEVALGQRQGTTNFQADVTGAEKTPEKFTFARQVEPGEKKIVTGLNRQMKEIVVSKKGPGWLYYNSLLEYERPLAPGLIAKCIPDDMHITRKFYKLTPMWSNGKNVMQFAAIANQPPAGYNPAPMSEGDTVKAGETIMMALTIDTPIAAPYVMVDAALPSGAEVTHDEQLVEPDSKKAQELGMQNYNRYQWSHQDRLDDRIVFFTTNMPAGKSQFTTFLRMEMPGTFNVNPVNLQAMYTKKVRGYSGIDTITVVESPGGE